MKIVIIKNNFQGMEPIMQVTQKHVDEIKSVAPDAQVVLVNDSQEDVEREVSDADIVLLDPMNLKHPVFEKAKNLFWIHTSSAGVNVLPKALLKPEIMITNSSGVHPVPIAQHVLCFMLMFQRQIQKSYRLQITKKTWVRDYNELPAEEISGKTVGIIGFGRIGSQIAKYCKAFDMHVFALVRNKEKQVEYTDKLFTMEEFDSMIAECDFIVNALPLTPETKYLYTKHTFSKMKKTAYFINIGRGGSVKETDLIDALRNKTIAGAALDVFEEEPLPSSSPLWDLDNVIITPHNSGWSPYYMDRVIAIFCANLKAYFAKEKLPNLIDKEKGY